MKASVKNALRYLAKGHLCLIAIFFLGMMIMDRHRFISLGVLSVMVVVAVVFIAQVLHFIREAMRF